MVRNRCHALHLPILSIGSFLHGEVKSKLALNSDWSSVDKVGFKAEGSQRVVTCSHQESIARDRHAGCYLSRLVNFDVENNVALNSLCHRFVGVDRHCFVFDPPQHYSVRNANRLRTSRLSLRRGCL